MVDPYEGKIKPELYFEDAKKVPPKLKSNFKKQIYVENTRNEAINKMLSRRELQETQKTETEISERLATEISDLKRKQFLEEKKRQQLRESNEELRELEAKLRSAYVSKSLAAQLAEREAIRAQEKDLQRKENEVMEKARIKNEEWEKNRMENDQKRKISLRKDLLEQISWTQQEKAKKYEDFIREKEIIDEIIRKINEEQLEEMREKLSKKLKFREETEEYIRIQKLWKEKLKQEAEEENRQILEYLKKQDTAAEEKAVQRKMEMRQREQISELIGQKILSIEVNYININSY